MLEKLVLVEDVKILQVVPICIAIIRCHHEKILLVPMDQLQRKMVGYVMQELHEMLLQLMLSVGHLPEIHLSKISLSKNELRLAKQ